ncbi:MAG: tetratricopeptide repeat protein [Planctomycetes bacterium]|nr:tetratricopeptide repeat protein [Planctomycetota bacterium]
MQPVAVGICVTLALATVGSAQSQVVETVLHRAAKALEAGNPGQAITSLGEALSKSTDPRLQQLLAAAHTRRGAVRFRAGDLDGAAHDFAAADRFEPGNAKILQSLGVIRMKQHRAREAKELMERVLKLDPNNSHALGVLGRIAVQHDDTERASHLLSRAAAQEPGRRDYAFEARKLSREAEVEAGFTRIARGSFELSMPTGKQGLDRAAESVLRILEQAHRELGQALGARPAKRIKVVLYTKAQFLRVRSAHAWARAYYDGKLRVALRQWPASTSELRRDLRHELTHAFLHELHPKAPLWLHEGYAQVLEGRSALGLAARFRSGADGLLPRAVFLGAFASNRDEDLVRRGYAQSLLLVDHLLRRGKARLLRQLLGELGRGTESDRALRLVYGRGLDSLLSEAVAAR